MKISKQSQEPKIQSLAHRLSAHRAQGHQPLPQPGGDGAAPASAQGEPRQRPEAAAVSGSSVLPLLLRSQGPTFQGENKGLTTTTESSDAVTVKKAWLEGRKEEGRDEQAERKEAGTQDTRRTAQAPLPLCCSAGSRQPPRPCRGALCCAHLLLQPWAQRAAQRRAALTAPAKANTCTDRKKRDGMKDYKEQNPRVRASTQTRCSREEEMPAFPSPEVKIKLHADVKGQQFPLHPCHVQVTRQAFGASCLARVVHPTAANALHLDIRKQTLRPSREGGRLGFPRPRSHGHQGQPANAHRVPTARRPPGPRRPWLRRPAPGSSRGARPGLHAPRAHALLPASPARQGGTRPPRAAVLLRGERVGRSDTRNAENKGLLLKLQEAKRKKR